MYSISSNTYIIHVSYDADIVALTSLAKHIAPHSHVLSSFFVQAKKEAKEAEEMKKEFYSKASIQEDSGNALATMIQSRQNQRMDSLMANLEAKYCQPKKTKKKGTAKVTKGKNK